MEAVHGDFGPSVYGGADSGLFIGVIIAIARDVYSDELSVEPEGLKVLEFAIVKIRQRVCVYYDELDRIAEMAVALHSNRETASAKHIN